jgi:hypothetical protein
LFFFVDFLIALALAEAKDDIVVGKAVVMK